MQYLAQLVEKPGVDMHVLELTGSADADRGDAGELLDAQRHMRDAEAVTHHFSVAQGVWEDVGRVLMGRKPNAPML